jgi:hypothetical protein|tara:strand:+ start:39 stop:782 length:744 start_codon:yes stop_codon:yes gene_type:complete
MKDNKKSDEKLLFDEYVSFFGDEPPFPPPHIMKSLVDMKKDGTFDEKMKKKGQLDKFFGIIEEVSGEKMSPEHPFFDIDFSENDLTLDEIVDLMIESVKNHDISKTLTIFSMRGMEKIPFEIGEHQKGLPEYKKVFSFNYKIDKYNDYYLDVLDSDGKVLQIDFVQLGREEEKSLKNNYKLIRDKCDTIFGISKTHIKGDMKTVGYDGGSIIVGILYYKQDNLFYLRMNVGNKELWKEIFNEEGHHQ